MNKPTPLPPAQDSQRHYQTPEGYFADLEARLLSQIPETTAEEAPTPPVTLWVRLRPILYMAAMFVAMNLIFRAFYPEGQSSPTTASAQSLEEDEDYTAYYADYGERMQAGLAYSSYYQGLAGESQASLSSYE